MALILGFFKVVEKTAYHGGRNTLVKLESTQVTSEMFAARVELMVIDPQVSDRFPLGAELSMQIWEGAHKKAIARDVR